MCKNQIYTYNFKIGGLYYEIYSDLPEVARYFKRAYSLFGKGGRNLEIKKKRIIKITLYAKDKTDEEVQKILSDAQAKIHRSWMDYLGGELVFFHASSVETKNRFIMFAGDGGSGKSTMAAMMRDKGNMVLNDDFSPVDCKSGNVLSFPIFPNIRKGILSGLQKRYSFILKEYFRRYGMLRRDYLFHMSDKEFKAYHSYGKEFYKPVKPVQEKRKKIVAIFLDKSRSSSRPKLSRVDFPAAFNMYINSIHMPLKIFHRSLKRIISLFTNFECYSLNSSSASAAAKLINSRFK